MLIRFILSLSKMHWANHPHTLSVSQGMTTDFSGTSQAHHSWLYLRPAGCQTLPCACNVSLLSRNDQRVTDSLPDLSLPVLCALYSHRLEPLAWSSITASADTQTLFPPQTPPHRLFLISICSSFLSSHSSAVSSWSEVNGCEPGACWDSCCRIYTQTTLAADVAF